MYKCFKCSNSIYSRYDNHEEIHHPGKEEGKVTTLLFKAGIRTIQTN